MTAEYIDFHAADRSDGVAIVDNGRTVTYATFARDIRKFTRALRALQLPRGSTAAIDCEEPYFNWLLRLAFEQLRVVTATVELPDRPDALSLVRDFDIVLSGKRFSTDAGPRYHPTTTEWLQGIVASADEDHEPGPEKRPDDPIRIVLTSGTTGKSKKLLYTRRVHETSIAKTLWCAGFTHHSRYLLALPTTVAGPAACIRAGGTVVFEQRMPVGDAIAAHAITHTTLPPFTLKRVLDELPAQFAKPPDLTIMSFGAAVSRALRERALARLATNVCDIYSANEAGYFSSIRSATEHGSIWPGVGIEVVDDHDRPLPLGEVGQIRVQTDYMLHGYLDDPHAAGRTFKDGWFYSGDVGILHDAHRLQVLGRSDDVLNLGWRKIAPEAIEDIVLKLGEVADVGVCGVPNRDGIEEICIAVAGQGSGNQELLRRITDAFRGFQFGRFSVIKVASIPRTANGKIQRRHLKDIAIATVRSG